MCARVPDAPVDLSVGSVKFCSVSTDPRPAPPEPVEHAGIPVLFRRLLDDAAVFPPGSASVAEAVRDHRGHRDAWYASLVGPLLVPTSALPALALSREPGDGWPVGVVADTGLAGLRRVIERDGSRDAPAPVRQVELAVAKRGEDPMPGVIGLVDALRGRSEPFGDAEVPLTWGLLGALDALAEARAAGVPVAAKFRTGGLAAELFPTPIELAAVVCACRDRQLPFKLTAGLHHAMRHTDPETGFVHHGFLNVLVASLAALDGGEVADVGALLAGTDPVPLIEVARRELGRERRLWVGFGSCSVAGPLSDLTRLGLLPPGPLLPRAEGQPR